MGRWRARFPDIPLTVSYFDDPGGDDPDAARVRLTQGTVDIAYMRSREGAAPEVPDLHRVVLYTEDPVVCAARSHWIAAAEESVTWADIAEETFFTPADMTPGQEPEPHVPHSGEELARAERIAMEVVASGAGLLLLPNSFARALSRKDVIIRRVEDQPGYDVALAWLRERDSDEIQEFVGIARGRKPQSARTQLAGASKKPPKQASGRTPADGGEKRRNRQSGPRQGRRPAARRRRG
ncbi:LysR substrate-binding domain-containing protein [Nesterenkonia pannonica]|uniref:LysR substrate-binding domain-containing protein n=1 Tax=Nesterenkonia pannonica TaxID=1548602 RepID=UPI002164830E|nr:LysR substrate-binding domain-containing protein [Nesterenkonia pannonica]